MKQEDNRIYCIARYNENLDWLPRIKGSIILYNKSENFEYSYPRHDIENFGRETETFIRFIVQYYNQLDSFDSVVFLQGNPFSHCEKIFDKLTSINSTSFEYLSDRIATSAFPSEDHFNMHLSTMCRLFNVEFDWDIDNFSNSANDSNSLLSGIRHIESCLSLCYSLDIPTKGKSFEWASGCQYQVPVHMIKSKPLQWWLNIHNMHTYFSRVKKQDFFSYVIETVWPLLVEHKSN